MFFPEAINGNDLPDKTVCLTFDDGPGETSREAGPGPRTLELAEFLALRSIKATFFVLGQRAASRHDIVQRVSEHGHLIGNHTYDHPALKNQNGDFAADQIMRTERELAGIPTAVRLFRAPYGCWDPEIARQLNLTEASSYTGPIGWDLDGSDWWHWREGRSAEECATSYIQLVQQKRKGIVLMHDSSFEDDIRSRSHTFAAAKLFVDWLQGNGYRFVPLDSIPQVLNALGASPISVHRG